MHPAISVIFFTVTSGAGFGFMFLIGLGVPLPADGLLAFLACLVAGSLAVAGLISSTFHLGHPERAWRAFSQWRSSWLSREGVLAVFTLLLFAAYGILWVFYGVRNPLLGLGLSIGAAVTVFATAMIYAQLKTVPAWHTPLTPVCYLLYALSGGVLLSASFGYWFESGGLPVTLVALLAIVVCWGAKLVWWQCALNDGLAARGSDTGTATGLGFLGKVRLLERPHSGENYLTREMVHQLARKHVVKLRLISLVLGCAIPVLLVLAVYLFNWPLPVMILSFIAFLAGLFVERWLFFAEAKHAVSLYY